MRQRILSGTMFYLVALATSSADADAISLTLSSPENLVSLTVGQTVEIDVTLSGLPDPNNPPNQDFIFDLNSKVDFSSSLFTAVPDPSTLSGLTAVVAPGSAFDNDVQGPLQIAAFQSLSSLTSSAAIGDFSDSVVAGSGAIGLNGLYFSFLLKATTVGSGTISFDTAQGANEYASNSSGFAFMQLPTEPPLSFTISPAPSIPEPSSIAMVALGITILGGWTRARKRSVA
jgi:hypothetical protein